MSTDGTDLFDLAERRLSWIDRRQGLLAQNIANANTPGYKASDLEPFSASLARVLPELAVTNPLHIGGSASPGRLDSHARPVETAPDGNAVSVDDQLTKIADTDGAHALVINLYHSYLGLFRTALDK